MATVLDVGLLNYMRPVFTFLFVFALIFAILLKTKLLGDNLGLSLLAAIGASILFLLTPGVVDVVNIMTPWFVVLFVILILMVLLFLFMGVNPEKVADAFKEPGLMWTIIIVVLIIFIYSMTKVFGAEVQPIAGTEESGNVVTDIGKVLFHPKLMGVIFILVVISFAIRLVSEGIK